MSRGPGRAKLPLPPTGESFYRTVCGFPCKRSFGKLSESGWGVIKSSCPTEVATHQRSLRVPVRTNQSGARIFLRSRGVGKALSAIHTDIGPSAVPVPIRETHTQTAAPPPLLHLAAPSPKPPASLLRPKHSNLLVDHIFLPLYKMTAPANSRASNPWGVG